MPGNGNPYADARDMYQVHAMFRREYALLPGLVRHVAAKNTERARVVADHVRLVNLILHHHHSAEDEILWPRLLQRASKDVDPVVRLLEAQHENLDVLLGETNARLDAWTAGADRGDGEALEAVLQRLAAGLYEHMSLEEELALPLVQRHIFAAEWEAMAERGAVGLPPEIGPLLVGMVMYEAGLDPVPPEAREAFGEVGPKTYASYCERVHGIPTPPLSSEVGLSLARPTSASPPATAGSEESAGGR